MSQRAQQACDEAFAIVRATPSPKLNRALELEDVLVLNRALREIHRILNSVAHTPNERQMREARALVRR